MNRIELIENLTRKVPTSTIIPIIPIKPGYGIVTHIKTELAYTCKVELLSCIHILDINDLKDFVQQKNTDKYQTLIIVLDEFDKTLPIMQSAILSFCENRFELSNNVKFIICTNKVPETTGQTFKVYPEIQTLNSQDVLEISKECIAEETDDNSTITVEGIVSRFTFDKAKLKDNESRIKDMLKELPKQFQEKDGGGYSFLEACMTCFDTQWTGMHSVMEQLFALGLGLNLVQCPLPREFWKALPGGLPYYVVIE